MTQILDLVSSGDPRDLIHRVVQALAEGDVVGLPFDTTYAICASAVQPAALRQIARSAAGNTCTFLAAGCADAAADFVPRPTPLQARLMQRCWPGPVLLQFPAAPPPTLISALPDAARNLIAPQQFLQLAVADSAPVRDVLRLLPAPLVVVAPAAGEPAIGSATGLESQFGSAAVIAVEGGRPRDAHPPSIVRALPDRWEMVFEGGTSLDDVRRQVATVILFVCTGNTCRSPMAEAIFRKLLAGRLQCPEEDLVERGFLVQSAGLSATHGMSAAREAVELMEGLGARLDRHSSRPVTPELLARADYVLTMTERHQFSLLDEYPEFASRVRLLSTEGTDIEDPIGAGAAEYRRCCDQIMGYLKELLNEVVPAGREG